MKINIECNEEQAQLMVNCLESVFRFMMPQQSGDLVNMFMDTLLKYKDEFDDEEKWKIHFERWLAKRECAYHIASALQKSIYGDYYSNTLPKEAHRISDIWSCLRHELYMSKKHEDDFGDVRGRSPIQLSDYALPKITVERDEKDETR